MAAPKDKTTSDLGGRWVLSNDLSTNADSVMAAQGLNWLTRKAISLARITTTIKHTGTEPSATFTLANSAGLNVQSTKEERTLNWQWQDFKDYIWGAFRDRSRYVHRQQLNLQAESRTEWLQNVEGPDEWVIESEVESARGKWKNHTVWGFKNVAGERRLVRDMHVRRGEETVSATLVYDYIE